MQWNTHFDLEGRHAFLSPSQYHWIGYDVEKLDTRYLTHKAALKGSELHDIASRLINLGIKLPRNNQTLNLYVNDAIGYRMKTEQPLYYSENCFGHTDAISFKNNFLRIHDLKTGKSPTSMSQLDIYAALFCLEYKISPNDLKMELRIYQNNEVYVREPSKEDILYIMQKIKDFDKRIKEIQIVQGW